MADPYAISTVTTTSGTAPSNTNIFNGITIGIGTLANLKGMRKRTHLRQTFYQQPGETLPLYTGGALNPSSIIIDQDRMGDGSGVTGPDIKWPDSNYRITSVTPFTASGSPKYQTIESYGVRLNDSLYQYCATPWMPELDGVSALIDAAHYGTSGYRAAMWCLVGATDLCVICPDAPTAHTGSVVPLLGKEYPPAPLASTRMICKGPQSLRHRLLSNLFSATDGIYWVWADGQNAAPSLGWRTRNGWLHPWWGLPPTMEVWVNDFIFLNVAVATPVYTMKVYLEQETVVYSAGSWSFVLTTTLVDTVTIPLSTRWVFSGATEVCAWATITTAAVGTLATNAIGFRYYAEAYRDGVKVGGTVTLPGGYTSTVNGLWCKVPPRSPNWASMGGNGELYQGGLALKTSL